jgi:hypothetical protein
VREIEAETKSGHRVELSVSEMEFLRPVLQADADWREEPVDFQHFDPFAQLHTQE